MSRTQRRKHRTRASQFGESEVDEKPVIIGKPLTKTQSTVVVYGGVLTNPLPATYKTYRTMRKQPTIALARALSASPVVAGEWSVEADDGVSDDRIELIESTFIPARSQLVETALLGGIDFGWQGFEKIFEIVGGQTRLRFKPLLQDITEILVVPESGAFAGYRQSHAGIVDLDLPLANSLHIGFRIEGTEWYGNSLLENSRSVYNDWVAANEGASRYDAKIAGSHWIVHYPFGWSDVDGNEIDNAETAKDILASLESSGRVIVPRATIEDIRRLNDIDPENIAWRIELLSDANARQESFVDRLSYLDKQMVRGLIIPERAILEGEFGTKAEAGVHVEMALTYMELVHEHITRCFNWYAVDQLLDLNYGPDARGTVRLEAAPLVDAKRAFMQELYLKWIANPSAAAAEYEVTDTNAMRESLGVPSDGTVDKTIATPVEGVDTEGADAATARRIFQDART